MKIPKFVADLHFPLAFSLITTCITTAFLMHVVEPHIGDIATIIIALGIGGGLYYCGYLFQEYLITKSK